MLLILGSAEPISGQCGQTPSRVHPWYCLVGKESWVPNQRKGSLTWLRSLTQLTNPQSLITLLTLSLSF